MTHTRFRNISSLLTVALILLATLGGVARAAGAAGAVRGTVTGPDAKPMGGVPLVLRNDITGFTADTRTDKDGRFLFFNVPFNPYELHVEVQGFQTQHIKLDVRSTAPVDVPVALALLAVSENVKVEAEAAAAVLETDSSTSHVDIDKSYIEHAPAANPSRGMEALIVQTPGFAQDENGYFHFAARTDDMIVSAGYNIAGPEVEAALLSHPDVAECAVVGAPDVERGQIVSAYVVLAAGIAADAHCVKRLQDHVKAVIAPYKYPRAVTFVDALPKTQTGKIQRFKLRHLN